jgi:GAF domain-containing protein
LLVTEPPSLMNALGADADDTLSWLTHAVVDALPALDYASISVLQGGDLATVGATDPLALKADSLQYELGEGPCVAAARQSTVVPSADAASDARWPAYAARVAELGIRAQAGLPIRSGTKTLGALNLYTTRKGALGTDELTVAAGYATQAATAMLLRRRVETLTQAVSSRTIISQAIGLVMERFSLDEDRALDYLVRVSQTSNVKLRQVARELVEQANTPD